MSPVAELNAIIPALKAGRAEAYRELVQVMGEPLLRYAISIVRDVSAAEDLVQDALLRIYRMRNKLDERAEFRGLCFRMVRNLARNAQRDRALRATREQEANRMRNEDSHGQELARDAWSLVASLGGELREVIELRFQHGLSRSEIAAALELPEGTVATRQRTALEALRERMAFSAPAAALPQLLTEGAAHHPSVVQPLDINGLEESLMAGIRTIRNKTAGMAAAALLGLLLLCAIGISTAMAVTSDNPGPGKDLAAARHTSSTARTPSRLASNVLPAQPEATAEADAKPDPATDQPAFTPADTKAAEVAQPAEPPTAQQPPAFAAPDAPPAELKPAPAASADSPPEFLSEPELTAVAGQPYEYTVRLAGYPAPALTAQNLPRWLNLQGLRLVGTPARADMGSCAFMLVASNGLQPEAQQRVQLIVNAAPIFKNSPEPKAMAGTAYKCDINVEALPAAALSLANAPKWLTLNGNTLAGSPTIDDAGVSNKMTLTASNGIKPDATLQFTVEVTAAPVFTSAPIVAAKEGMPYIYKVTVRGHPAPAVDVSSLPKWLTFANGELTGAPRTADVGKSKKITLRAKNGIKPDAEQTFSIDVESNADYVELPWDVDDMKRYFKVGLKWKLKGSTTISDSTGDAAISHDDADTECEVTAVDANGFTVKSIFDTGISVAGTTVTRTTDQKTETIPWAKAMEFARRSVPKDVAQSTKRTQGSETLVLLGKSYKCTVYTWTSNIAGNVSEVRKIYFAADLPFGAVRYCRQLTTGTPGVFTTTDTYTQSLSSLNVPRK